MLIKRQQEINKAASDNNYHESDYMFTWEDGHLYTPDYLSKAFKKIIRMMH